MMPSQSSQLRRASNDLLNAPGFLGAAARFWQVRTATVSVSRPLTSYGQRSYAADYVGLAILITGYILVRISACIPRAFG
jgi:diacylglycerol diphosphate phosphatase/phosphatidate phosphatase